MPRPKKEVPKAVKEQAAKALQELSVADQLVPLIFDKENMAILLTLGIGHETNGLPFTAIGELTGLGKSQKLVDMLNHMIEYGLAQRSNGKYDVTELGLSAANFARNFIEMISSDTEIAKRTDLASYYPVVQDIEKKSRKLLESIIRRS